MYGFLFSPGISGIFVHPFVPFVPLVGDQSHDCPGLHVDGPRWATIAFKKKTSYDQ